MKLPQFLCRPVETDYNLTQVPPLLVQVTLSLDSDHSSSIENSLNKSTSAEHEKLSNSNNVYALVRELLYLTRTDSDN